MKRIVTDEMRNEYSRKIRINLFRHYELDHQKMLGRGSYGTVRVGTCRNTQEKVAVKCIDRRMLNMDRIMRLDLQEEINCMLRLKHPNVIQLKELYDDDDEYFYMVMEIAQGGELFDRILKKKTYSEREAQKFMDQAISAVRLMHSKGIVHRDIKPENFVYGSTHEDACVKLIDFGFAQFLGTGKDKITLNEVCGTPGYSAPEVLLGKSYQFSCDIWSLGVVLYTLLAGFQPFYHPDPIVEENRVFSGDLRFPNSSFQYISDDAMDLIEGMLEVDPRKRLSINQILHHPWCDRSILHSTIPLPHVISGIHHITARNRWQKAITISRIIARTKLFASYHRQDALSSTKPIFTRKRSQSLEYFPKAPQEPFDLDLYQTLSTKRYSLSSTVTTLSNDEDSLLQCCSSRGSIFSLTSSTFENLSIIDTVSTPKSSIHDTVF